MENKVCPICGKTYVGYGNNAYPLAQGRCCDECNAKVIEKRKDYLFAGGILNPMVENLKDDNNCAWISECEVNGVPVNIELVKYYGKHMCYVYTKHEKGFNWFKLFNEYLDFAINKVA